MAKKVIHLTEEELNKVVKESTLSVLNEIGYRGASLTHGANYNASNKIMKGINVSQNMNKLDRSNSISMEAISKALQDNCAPIELLFIERDNSNNQYTVKFYFESVFRIDNRQFVLKGKINRGQKGYVDGAIEYNFSEGRFYDVKFWGKDGIRRIYPLTLINTIPQNEQKCKDVLDFLSNYLYSNEDYETNVNLNS
jgi:hypothetical protein